MRRLLESNWAPLAILAVIGLVLWLLSLWSVGVAVGLFLAGFAWVVYAVERS